MSLSDNVVMEESPLSSLGTYKTLPPLDEYESSIYIKIPHSFYEDLLKKIPPQQIQMILYFINGVRLANHRIQYKILLSKTCILKFYHTHDSKNPVLFLPLTRKHSQEFTVMMPQDISKIETVIVRHIIMSDKLPKNYTLRISLERCFGVNGGHYALNAEIEYDKKYYNNYTALSGVENVLMNKLKEILNMNDDFVKLDTNARFLVPSQETLFKVPSRTFSNFTEFGYFSIQRKQCVMYKFDGYKGKLAYRGDGNILYFDDLVQIQCTQSSLLSFASRIIFQVEVMKGDENSNVNNAMILVDVLGGYIGNQLYMPEPMDVIDFFEKINQSKLIKPTSLMYLPKQGWVSVFTQYRITEKTLNPKYKFDGTIIINDYNIFKFKVPTIEALLLNGYLFLQDRIEALSTQTFLDPKLEQEKIYEIALERGSSLDPNNISFEILRKRKDRVFPSNTLQYEDFLNNIKFMRRNTNRHMSVNVPSNI